MSRGFLALLLFAPLLPGAATVDLSRAVVVVRGGDLPNAEKTAAIVLRQEIENRSRIHLAVSTSWPASGPVIAITSDASSTTWGRHVPAPDLRAEGFRVRLENGQQPVVWIAGADARGALFGVGYLLRKLDYAGDRIAIASPLDVSTSPAYPIRGHQLGYRAQANSYDAWSPAQFEQYIRELTFFGANSIESIPFQDDRPSPVMKTSRREMNRAMSEICYRYGLDYWAWIPADFDLKDTARRGEMLGRLEEFFRDSKELTGLFFPGGDPGQNPPELVLPYLEDVARRLLPLHPKARIWLSLQWFTPAQVDLVYSYLDRTSPAWFGGLVGGPSSPPVPATRARLPKRYQLRLYPDLTHNKLSQHQVPHWDQAYALTLGREAINPRPAEFARIFRQIAPFSDGFISYSDGIHDDVNKTVWSALSWNPDEPVRDILLDYANVYFDSSVAGPAADAILALEKNWYGPLVDNGSVESTLLTWQTLSRTAPSLASNWRWQMCQLRANYDAFVRRRLLRETKLERDANAILADARERGAAKAMDEATEILKRAVTDPTSPDIHARIEELCDKLFHSIGLQSSVEKYHASGEERGAVLDFVDYPLNNRWWLEDQFKEIRSMPSEPGKIKRLLAIATWENPGPGSFYDDVGNESKSPHVVWTDAKPTFWWWDQGKSRARLSWQVTMWPSPMVYQHLDPNGTYVIRSTGFGQALLSVNGERVQPTVDGQQMGEFKVFPVDPKFLKSGTLTLTWDRPPNEGSLNWRKKSRLSEVWLLKKR